MVYDIYNPRVEIGQIEYSNVNANAYKDTGIVVIREALAVPVDANYMKYSNKSVLGYFNWFHLKRDFSIGSHLIDELFYTTNENKNFEQIEWGGMDEVVVCDPNYTSLAWKAPTVNVKFGTYAADGTPSTITISSTNYPLPFYLRGTLGNGCKLVVTDFETSELTGSKVLNKKVEIQNSSGIVIYSYDMNKYLSFKENLELMSQDTRENNYLYINSQDIQTYLPPGKTLDDISGFIVDTTGTPSNDLFDGGVKPSIASTSAATFINALKSNFLQSKISNFILEIGYGEYNDATNFTSIQNFVNERKKLFLGTYFIFTLFERATTSTIPSGNVDSDGKLKFSTAQTLANHVRDLNPSNDFMSLVSQMVNISMTHVTTVDTWNIEIFRLVYKYFWALAGLKFNQSLTQKVIPQINSVGIYNVGNPFDDEYHDLTESGISVLKPIDWVGDGKSYGFNQSITVLYSVLEPTYEVYVIRAINEFYSKVNFDKYLGIVGYVKATSTIQSVINNLNGQFAYMEVFNNIGGNATAVWVDDEGKVIEAASSTDINSEYIRAVSINIVISIYGIVKLIELETTLQFER